MVLTESCHGVSTALDTEHFAELHVEALSLHILSKDKRRGGKWGGAKLEKGAGRASWSDGKDKD